MKLRYSHSRRDVLARCMRQYYYEYYAASLQRQPSDSQGMLFAQLEPIEKTEIDVERLETVRKLKGLTSCPLVAGNILHKLIAIYLRKIPDWGVDWFVRKAEERFDRFVSNSRDHDGHDPTREQSTDLAVMLEFYYGNADADNQAWRAREKLIGATQRFFMADSIIELCQRIVEGEYLVEKQISGITIDNCAIGGQVDLVGRVGGSVEVVDWKIGCQSGFQDSLQLITYGWWAARHYSVDPVNVRVRRVFLGDGKIEEGSVLSDALIRRTKARIIQDVELMKELHIYGKVGNKEAFTPCGKENVCRQCKYQQVCGKEHSATSSRPTSDLLPVKQQSV